MGRNLGEIDPAGIRVAVTAVKRQGRADDAPFGAHAFVKPGDDRGHGRIGALFIGSGGPEPVFGTLAAGDSGNPAAAATIRGALIGHYGPRHVSGGRVHGIRSSGYEGKCGALAYLQYRECVPVLQVA